MNEVNQIHLGRQPYTIAADAHATLRTYLEAIKRQAGGDVADEVELRMAELLTERGISGDKVILPADIDFLKTQLGDPKDFKEDDSEPTAAEPTSRRLFRDTHNGMIAGVAAGLANYTGVDVLLIRIILVATVLAGGWGILLYILLWLLVPEAKSSSERLQMHGKAVTIDSLKEVVSRADVPGVAKRANRTLAGPINSIFRILLQIIGVIAIVVGLSLLLGFIGLGSYTLIHTGSLFGQDVFPVGTREHLLLGMGLAVSALLSVLVIVLGVAMFKRTWPIKAWATGTLVGLLLVGLIGTAALGADAAPHIRDRYQAHFHTTVRNVEPFQTIQTEGDNVRVNFQLASTYSVRFKYYDHPDLSGIKTTVSNGTLTVDSDRFDPNRHCPSQCIPDTYLLEVTVYSPTRIDLPDSADLPAPPAAPSKD